MLNNPGFVSKAPADKIALEKAKLEKHKENLAELTNKLNKNILDKNLKNASLYN